MKIRNDLNIFVDRRFLVNSYLLMIDKTCVVIDPGLNAETIQAYIATHGLMLVGIVLTHAHYDHIGNTFALVQKYHVNVYLHQDERPIIERHHFAKELNLPVNINYDLINYYQGNKLTVGKFNFAVLLLKGHTPGGVVLRYHHYIFSGDTVFYDSIGRTDLALGSLTDMNKSLKLFSKFCKDDDCILPGHGSNGL
jgi:glyoxylase-like metal-dependent hydrolase (beta-lactamase superfamily II)